MRLMHLAGSLCALAALLTAHASDIDSRRERSGYYRFPAVHGDTVVFTSEGDLWSVSIGGGSAHRLTSNMGLESHALISPDGRTVAFVGQYEGPSEVYTMPLLGGVPARRTFDGDSLPAAFSSDGRLLISTTRFSTLPDARLALLSMNGDLQLLPLAQGAEASYSADGRTLYFTRFRKQSSFTKRYQGGGAESIWRFQSGKEAVPLTADWPGTSHSPLVFGERVYFLSDRDGVMNLWSMNQDGHDLKQVSHQKVLDIESASLSEGRVVYASGADLWVLDLDSGREQVIPISLVSDFDQLRDHWVLDPASQESEVHLAPDGQNVVVTTRGEVFTLPATTGPRIVKVAAKAGVRYRSAQYEPDGKHITLLSTESGETEFWQYPANGVGGSEQLTHNAAGLRWDGVPSPNGRWFAHRNKNQELWLLDRQEKRERRILQSRTADILDLRWSPDSRLLAFVETAGNSFRQIKLLNVETAAVHTVTTDRFNSQSPTFSQDGRWLYFLSDRMLKSTVQSVWGARQPDPHFARAEKLYQVAMQSGLRSPFLPADELHLDNRGEPKEKAPSASASKKPEVAIDFADIQSRIEEVPAPAGNYRGLEASNTRLCWLNDTDERSPKSALQCLNIDNKGEEPETLVDEIRSFEFSLDRKKLLLVKAAGNECFVFDANASAGTVNDSKATSKAKVNLSQLVLKINPREEFHGLFLDAWRLERDYFYDRNMHGVDWSAIRERYLPLVDRVSDRDELNAVIAQMVAELSALHTWVRGGDVRKAADQIALATLGAVLRRDEKAGGFVVEHVYLSDPDLPNEAAPLMQPQSRVQEGEVIVSIDGESASSAADERALLLGKAGAQVLLRVKSSRGELRDVLVTPLSAEQEAALRYTEWEFTRRRRVEMASDNAVGYVHLRAMEADDIDQWARDFYPVFNRQGLIIDVRHNRGGNIDSWLLGKLLRQAWLYFQPRVGDPTWNMQYAFRGHLVILCDQDTESDGEAFSEGVRRFKLGKLIGTRTWGGEIWLHQNNFLADGGIATAAEIGVFGSEGKWLIEGHGVDPDVVIDNLPYAAAAGEDAQLEKALELLKEEIRKDPRPVPQAPGYPNKSRS